MIMKNCLSLCLAVVLSSSAMADGISSIADLEAFARAVNTGGDLSAWQNERGEVVLTADMDMSEAEQFVRIENFQGVFDGQGHAIRNWKTDKGFFGLVDQGSIVRNLVIAESCTMKVSDVNEKPLCAGFVVDVNRGILEHCENFGSVVHRSPRPQHNNYVGGICGMNQYVIFRCRNAGEISSSGQGMLSDPNVRPRIHLGGILGGGSEESLPGAIVAYCENSGTISYSGSFLISCIGGIAGYNINATTKFCMNRGDLLSTAQNPGQNKDGICQEMVGGICGMTKADVMCCDNFGRVVTRGDAYSLTAGICGSAHDVLTLGNCTNFALVTSASPYQAAVGGIVGRIGRPVVISHCCNKGPISFEGESVDRRSVAGGIAGDVYTRENAVYASSIRNCRNEGDVYSASGGNMRNSIRGIHTAGIVGFIGGNQSAQANVCDCVNIGRVDSGSGRAGGIVGFANCCDFRRNENRGTVAGSGMLLGGVVAAFNNGQVFDCTNRGDVLGGPGSLSGGIAATTWNGGNSRISACRNCGAITGKFGLAGSILGVGRTETDRIERCGVGGGVGMPGQSGKEISKVLPANFGQFITGRNVVQNKAFVNQDSCYYWDGDH